MEILKEVLKEIKPTQKEREELKKKITNFLNKLNKSLKDAKAILGGSGAKDTWLKGVKDADIFVLFNYKKYKDKSDKLSDILEPILKKHFKITRLHGSRDYFQIKEKNFTFEVVPILNIKKPAQAMNITDISPLHALFVKKYSKLCDEIRLLKKFCKAQNCYGAESYISGFSGYACEVLIIYYGSFINLVKKAVKWKPKVVIDLKRYYKGKNPLNELNPSKLQSPLVIIDPVQKTRNITAALSLEKFNIFKKTCQRFLKRPSKEFFEEKKFSIEDLRKKAKNRKLILLDIIALSGKEDIVGSKLLKALKWIVKKLKQNDFKVVNYGWEWDKKKKALFWIITNKRELPKYKEIIGPPLTAPKHFIANFKKKYKKTFTRNGRLWAKTKRTFTKPENLVKNLIKTDKYIKAKVSKIAERKRGETYRAKRR